MKYLLCIAWMSSVAAAEHGSPRLTLFPEHNALPVNGVIALLSNNGDFGLPNVGDSGWQLTSGGQVVPVSITKRYIDYDGYGDAAAILKPHANLVVGQRYTLTGGGSEWGQWTTVEADHIPPKRVSAKIEQGKWERQLTLQLKSEPVVMGVYWWNAGKIRRDALLGLDDDGCAFIGYLAGDKGPSGTLRVWIMDAGGNRTRVRYALRPYASRDPVELICLTP